LAVSYYQAVPARSPDQRKLALAEANRVRAERARFKVSLHRLTSEQALRMAAALVARPPEWATSWRVAEPLISLPKWGPRKVARVMGAAGLREGKRLGSLTDRQRAALIEELGG
jgi:hypothetical protein